MTTPIQQPLRQNRQTHTPPERRTFVEPLAGLPTEGAALDAHCIGVRPDAPDAAIALQRLSSVVSSTCEPDQIVSALSEITAEIIPSLESGLFLFDGASETLHPVCSTHTPSFRAAVQMHLEEGLLGRGSTELAIVIVPAHDGSLPPHDRTNLIFVPLVLENRKIGVYTLRTRTPSSVLSPDRALLVSLLATQAALGIELLRSRRELIDAREEVEAFQAQTVQAAKLAAIGELAAGIAHEIKNPLQIMMLHLEMVKAGKALPDWTEMFSAQVRRLSDIAIRLMRFARDASDDVTMEPVSVNRAIEEIVAMVHHDFEGSGIDMELSLHQTLPLVMGNLNYLQQVFLNLLINARDAMPKGGRVAIITAHTGFHVSIQVSDTGAGIGKEVLERIFEPFFTTKGERGTGLGLTICRKIIAQHKGELRVESEIDRGTTFTIYLPAWRTPVDRASQT